LKKKGTKGRRRSRVLVAYTCNPNHSGSRDQEDRVQSQCGQIVKETLSWKNPLQKMAGGVAQGVQALVPQKKKKKKTIWHSNS
jgi:hypothetical protein